MHFTYILRSLQNGRLYVGCTYNVERRLSEHNSGKTVSTKPYRPYELIFYEALPTTEESVEREKFYKSGRGREVLKKILFKTLSADSAE